VRYNQKGGTASTGKVQGQGGMLTLASKGRALGLYTIQKKQHLNGVRKAHRVYLPERKGKGVGELEPSGSGGEEGEKKRAWQTQKEGDRTHNAG